MLMMMMVMACTETVFIECNTKNTLACYNAHTIDIRYNTFFMMCSATRFV